MFKFLPILWRLCFPLGEAIGCQTNQALVYALLDQLFTSNLVIIYIHNIFHKKMTLIIVIRNDKNDNDGDDFTAWKASKYGVFSGPYFPVCGLNTEIYGVNLRV